MLLLDIFVDMNSLTMYLCPPPQLFSKDLLLRVELLGFRVGLDLRLPNPITDLLKDGCIPSQAGWHRRTALTVSHWQTAHLS